jgi:hypothetical protein
MSDNWDELFDDLMYSGRVGSDESRVAARAALRSAISAMEQERDNEKRTRENWHDATTHLMDINDKLEIELEIAKQKIEKIITECENPNNRTSHTLLQQCKFLDKLKSIAMHGHNNVDKI